MGRDSAENPVEQLGQHLVSSIAGGIVHSELTSIRQGTAGNSIELVLESRPFPDAELDWDRDAIDAVVNVEAGAFRGNFTTTVWSHELTCLRRLLEELGNRVGRDADAVFRIRESTIRMTFELEKTGHLCVVIEASENPADAAKIQFEIHADQSYIHIWIESIDAALKKFPQRIKTGEPYDPLHID